MGESGMPTPAHTAATTCKDHGGPDHTVEWAITVILAHLL